MAPQPEQIVKTAKEAFNSGRTKPVEFRLKQIESLLRLYEENKTAMFEALTVDLRKSKQEALMTELDCLINDCRNIIYNLKEWVKPEKPPKGTVNLMDGVYIFKEPYGVVLVIGAWNYPLQLSLMPLAGAIAAGNCVILKPSELAPASAKLVSELLPKYIDKECYQVYNGGVPETTALLQQRFDYIFFTGSPQTGKIVHQAAAKHLTPTTLELGGKSPAYLDSSADIDIATRRILWGKCLNVGQTCIAPDYLICSKIMEQKFLKTAEKVLKEWFGEKPKKSPDYGRIINERHFKRLTALLSNCDIAIGGDTDIEDKYIEPTIVTGVKPNDPIMTEEIFGPILPIITMNTVEDAIKFINEREKPLALYVFSNNKNITDKFINDTSSGGVCINDTLMHFSVENLPFGGVGNSGMGSYHGKGTFDTFSHHKGVLVKDLSKLGEMLTSSRYPPYSDAKSNFISTMTKKRKGISLKILPYVITFGLGVCAAYAINCYITFLDKKH